MAENLNNKKHLDKSKNKDPLFYSVIKSKITYTVKDNGETLTVVKGKSRWRNAKSENCKKTTQHNRDEETLKTKHGKQQNSKL